MRHRRALDLAIPRRVASQQSSTPFHQATTSIPSVSREQTSTRLRDFRLWMVLESIFQPESHSRATENYPQFPRAAQVVRLPRRTMGQSPDQDGDRNSDPAPGPRTTDVLPVRLPGAGLRSEFRSPSISALPVRANDATHAFKRSHSLDDCFKLRVYARIRG